MRSFLALALTAFVVGSFVVVTPARADHGSSSNRSDTDFNATVALTLANPGQSYSDAQGNRYLQGLVYTGQLSGWPVTGTLRIDANVSFQAGSTTGEIDGSYVISDGGANSFRGDLSETRVQESANGLLVAARMNIEGGTGLFDDARGSARIAGILPSLAVTAAASNLNLGVQPVAYGPPWSPGPLQFIGPGQVAGPAQFAGQPQYGVLQNAITPWQVDPNQPTLAISGHIAMKSSATTNALRSLSASGQFPNTQLQSVPLSQEAQRAFQEAVRYFLSADDNDHSRARSRSNDNNRGNNRGRGRD
jgi:hypothetical protein